MAIKTCMPLTEWTRKDMIQCYSYYIFPILYIVIKRDSGSKHGKTIKWGLNERLEEKISSDNGKSWTCKWSRKKMMVLEGKELR